MCSQCVICVHYIRTAYVNIFSSIHLFNQWRTNTLFICFFLLVSRCNGRQFFVNEYYHLRGVECTVNTCTLFSMKIIFTSVDLAAPSRVSLVGGGGECKAIRTRAREVKDYGESIPQNVFCTEPGSCWRLHINKNIHKICKPLVMVEKTIEIRSIVKHT